ncbi:MAG: WhiB family transcriptional regulator [Actinobacteria bacterium]|jgi:WhiB family redox-sensing transcriptional regulator|nr:MAG: WhiB family transcriptional regulator [Actinomycetota bacterium]
MVAIGKAEERKFAPGTPEWGLARCRAADASLLELFFSEDLADIAKAKTICAACPVQAPCLAAAESRREPWGVWGGELFANGKVLALKRRRGRPPKNEQSQLTA